MMPILLALTNYTFKIFIIMEEYLVLATTNEKNMSNIINQVLDNNKIFWFGELLEDKFAKAVCISCSTRLPQRSI